MDSTSSENIKSKYKLGQFVLGKVEFHTPFGVFAQKWSNLSDRKNFLLTNWQKSSIQPGNVINFSDI